jgi:hypothetical protein
VLETAVVVVAEFRVDDVHDLLAAVDPYSAHGRARLFAGRACRKTGI